MPWESLRSVWDASQRRHVSGRSTLLENWAANSSSMMGDGLYIVCSTTQVSIHTHKHTQIEQSPGAIRVSVSCPRPLRHQGPGIKPPTSQFWTMALPPRATLVISPDAPQLVFRKTYPRRGSPRSWNMHLVYFGRKPQQVARSRLSKGGSLTHRKMAMSLFPVRETAEREIIWLCREFKDKSEHVNKLLVEYEAVWRQERGAMPGGKQHVGFGSSKAGVVASPILTFV